MVGGNSALVGLVPLAAGHALVASGGCALQALECMVLVAAVGLHIGVTVLQVTFILCT